jgi:hypothetical protein
LEFRVPVTHKCLQEHIADRSPQCTPPGCSSCSFASIGSMV